MEKRGPEPTKDQAERQELLHHYTDQNGLLGILNSDCLWATHYRFLNDLSERQEALCVFLDAIARRTSNANAEGPSRRTAEAYQTQVREGVLYESQAIDAYFVSFSRGEQDPQLPPNEQALGDRLSQWRGYAQDRQGFSLEFDKKILKNRICPTIATPRVSACFLNCVYVDEFKQAGIDTVLGYGEEEIRKWKQSASEQDINQLSQWKQLFHQFLSGFKHIGFEEERECRLVLQMLAKNPELEIVKFRDGRFGRTPYVEVPIGLREQNSPLRRIVVGPSQNKEQTVQSLKIELAKMGIHGVEVVPSQIPYRNW